MSKPHYRLRCVHKYGLTLWWVEMHRPTFRSTLLYETSAQAICRAGAPRLDMVMQ